MRGIATTKNTRGVWSDPKRGWRSEAQRVFRARSSVPEALPIRAPFYRGLASIGAPVPCTRGRREACSSYADATYRKRRNASSSTRLMADDPIHNRDWRIADSETGRFGLRLAGLRLAPRLWMGYSVLGGALMRRPRTCDRRSLRRSPERPPRSGVSYTPRIAGAWRIGARPVGTSSARGTSPRPHSPRDAGRPRPSRPSPARGRGAAGPAAPRSPSASGGARSTGSSA